MKRHAEHAMKWLPCIVLATGLAACGSEDVSVLYGAERVLWRADRAQANLPLPALADSGRAWRAQATRYDRIAETYENWAAWNPDSPVREDLLGVASSARWSAVRVHKTLADTLSMRRELDRLVAPETHDPAIVVRALRRRADVSAANGDFDAWVADLRRIWSIVLPSNRWVRNVIGVPAEIVEAQLRRGDPDSVAAARRDALEVYETLTTRESVTLTRLAHLESASLLNDVGRFEDSVALLKPELDRILRVRGPRGDEIRYVVRTVELMADALSAGAVKPEFFEDPLKFIVLRSFEVGRPHAALADAFAERGDDQRALEMYRLIRRKHDDATWGPYVTRAEAELYARANRWKQNEVAIDLLRTRYALTPEALDAPLALRRFRADSGDPLGAARALEAAIDEYRSLRRRYPEGAHTDRLILRLSEALELRGATDEAYALRLEWIDLVRGRAAELERLAETVRVGRRMLRPDAEIRPLLERIAALFPGTRLGARAARELQSPEP